MIVAETQHRHNNGCQERDLDDPQAISNLAVAPFTESRVDFVELAIDPQLDLIQFLADIIIGDAFDLARDSADQAFLLDPPLE